MRYCCGFLFNEGTSGPRIILIRKSRPAWQVGCLNGIGGKIEPGESDVEAMRRECMEEAGIYVELSAWEHVAALFSPAWEVQFFAAWLEPELFDRAVTRTDEPIVRHAVSSLWNLRLVPNLRVLIPLALDRTGITKPVLMSVAGNG